jgi:hypothetical protein
MKDRKIIEPDKAVSFLVGACPANKPITFCMAASEAVAVAGLSYRRKALMQALSKQTPES